MNDLRGVRFTIVGVLATAALSACGADGTPAPATPPPVSTVATAEPTPTPTPEPVPDLPPATVEQAVTEASGCAIDEKFGRTPDGVRFGLTGLGPGGPPPQEALDGSFTCDVDPAGTLLFAAARYDDAAQAAAMVAWFQGGDPCRPVGTAGSWMIFAARAADQPQQSEELESAVSDLGGRMAATCRAG